MYSIPHNVSYITLFSLLISVPLAIPETTTRTPTPHLHTVTLKETTSEPINKKDAYIPPTVGGGGGGNDEGPLIVAIIGGVIGGLILLVIIIMLFLFCCRKTREKQPVYCKFNI